MLRAAPVVEHVGAGQEGGHKAAVLGLQVERSAVKQAPQPEKNIPGAKSLGVVNGISVAERGKELRRARDKRSTKARCTHGALVRRTA